MYFHQVECVEFIYDSYGQTSPSTLCVLTATLWTSTRECYVYIPNNVNSLFYHLIIYTNTDATTVTNQTLVKANTKP